MKRRQFLLGLAGAAMLASATPLRAITLTEALSRKFRYRILSGDKEIGQHTVSIARKPEGLTLVEHHRTISVKLLFVPFYNLELNSQEIWRGETLTSLHAQAEENGQRSLVEGRAIQDAFTVSGPDGDFEAPAALATTESFWGSWALEKPHVLDTLKGKLVTPRVRPLLDGRWHLEHEEFKADIRFEGNFMSDADIDTDGHMVRFVRASG